MLDDDPPAGTRVAFTHAVLTPRFRTAPAAASATLKRSMDYSLGQRPEDRCEIEYEGETFVVQRRDIRRAQG